MPTKTIIAALAGLLLWAAPAAAEVAGGFKTGLNIATFVGDDARGAGGDMISKAGLAIGGFIIFPLEKVPFKLQPEFLLSSKGAVYKWDVLGAVYENTVSLTYLEIPVLARFEVPTRHGVTPAVLLGPYLGIKVSAKSESRTIGASSTADIDNIKAIDPGFAVGALVDIDTNRGVLSLEARYSRSLATIVEDSGGGEADIRNSAASILVGYKF
ncbi:MAG: porin family protein [Dehalococcoidales bacterium]|nr:porin family protein [Dehalococcoidales bacterium]